MKSLLAILIVTVGLASSLPAADTTVVTLDPNSVLVGRFMGFGVQVDPYEYQPSPAAWKLTLERLDHMHPAFFRVMWRANPYCLGFDEAGNPRYVWNQGEAAVRERLGPLFAILDYAQARNIDVMLGEWDPAERAESRYRRRHHRSPGSALEALHHHRLCHPYLTTRRNYTIINVSTIS